MRPVNTKLVLTGGLLTGIAASACCVGPLLLLSLGIGGAWIGNLTALERYRPVFIVLTLLFAAAAYRKIYAVRPDCGPGGCCAAEPGRRTLKLLFWILTPVMLLLVAAPWLLPLFYH